MTTSAKIKQIDAKSDESMQKRPKNAHFCLNGMVVWFICKIACNLKKHHCVALEMWKQTFREKITWNQAKMRKGCAKLLIRGVT